MNKFEKLICNNSNAVLARRAANITTNAKIAQQTIINDLTQKLMNVELRIADATDFAPESTVSLTPGSKNWDAKIWAQNLQKLKMEKYNIEINLKLAQETYNEFFKDEPVNSEIEDK